jgi:signal transduction histidine kinase
LALRFLGSLRGLRVQLLLWTVLPLTLVLIGVTIAGITGHQSAMRAMVEELDARSARLAAAHLNEALAQRAALLQLLAESPGAGATELLGNFFDGGYAVFNSSATLVTAVPSPAAWQKRLSDLSPPPHPADDLVFVEPFIDPVTGQYSVQIIRTRGGVTAVGVVSLNQLGLTEAIGPPGSRAVAYLVDGQGQVIYHPDPAIIGQNLATHAGVKAALAGQAGATYHQEPGGQELAVGYAPVPETGWSLIVQEPWEDLIAPVMRFSLLAPLAVVVAALVSALAVSFGLHYVIRPLQMLDRQATRLAWGDFGAITEPPVGGVQEIEDLRRTLAGMAEQIRRYQAGMRDYIAAITHAQEEERKRLARELHDETVQSLIALGHRIDMVQRELERDPPKAQRRLAELRQLTESAQQEVRRFSRALRPLYLEDLGFVPALEMLAQETERQHHLAVRLNVEGQLRRLPADLELTAYRVVQEGVSNVVRHAQASEIDLTVIFETTELTLRIQDDGRGFVPPVNPAALAETGHFGLMGLHERALLFGGRLQIQAAPGQGVTLHLHLAVPPES